MLIDQLIDWQVAERQSRSWLSFGVTARLFFFFCGMGAQLYAARGQ
jgi:hypothetical protein